MSEPPRRLDWELAAIDTIIRREGDRYCAIIKHERYPTLDWTTSKTIRICSSTNLLGPYSEPGPREAPLIRLPDGTAWYLYYEQYPGVAYGLSVAARLSGPWFQVSGGTPGTSTKYLPEPGMVRCEQFRGRSMTRWQITSADNPSERALACRSYFSDSICFSVLVDLAVPVTGLRMLKGGDPPWDYC